MFEILLQDFESKFPGKKFLTIEEVATVLDCPKRVVYNWLRSSNPDIRPPKIQNGKWIRIPTSLFVQWLIKNQENLRGK